MGNNDSFWILYKFDKLHFMRNGVALLAGILFITMSWSVTSIIITQIYNIYLRDETYDLVNTLFIVGMFMVRLSSVIGGGITAYLAIRHKALMAFLVGALFAIGLSIAIFINTYIQLRNTVKELATRSDDIQWAIDSHVETHQNTMKRTLFRMPIAIGIQSVLSLVGGLLLLNHNAKYDIIDGKV